MRGTRLGPYEIVEQLGAGGMGEVWLAQDTRLGRKVAVKVLPEQFASDPERLARFEQEARAAAALNHPHIATVHDVGHEGGVHFMVQEFIEGEPLREVLERDRLPLARALDLGIEIAEGLTAAHSAGIVHRDLKPDNIFVTTDGHAKILDFGLAKLMEASLASGPDGATRSPTVLGTVAGQVMGTAGYMAPEQVDGGKIDARADVFALGCVLYEMATGTRAFAGKSLIDTLHKIAHSEPRALEEIDRQLPADLHRVLAKCMAKEPERRYQHTDDVAVDLRALSSAVAAGTAAPAGPGPAIPAGGGLRPAPLLAAAAAGLLVGAVAMWMSAGTAPVAGDRVAIRMRVPTELNMGINTTFAWAPDGSEVFFAAAGQEQVGSRLWSRRLNDFELRAIPNAEGGELPFISPDGRWLGFGRQRAIWRVPRAGGAPEQVLEVGVFDGGAWDSEGTLYFAGRPADEEAPLGLYRLLRGAAAPERLWSVQDSSNTHRALLPQVWPGDRGVVFTVFGEPAQVEDDAVFFWSPAHGAIELFRGGIGAWPLGDRHLAYVQADYRIAIRGFDPGAASLDDDPPISTDYGVRQMNFAVSPGGDLALLAGGGPRDVQIRLVLADLEGNLEPLDLPTGPYNMPRFSPAGDRIAMIEGMGFAGNVLLVELDPTPSMRPLPRISDTWGLTWSPDGSELAVSSSGYGVAAVSINDSAAEPRRIVEGWILANEWPTPDRLLTVRAVTSSLGIHEIHTDTGTSTPFLDTEAMEGHPRLSNDGRWLAYTSDATGRTEVYARPYPAGSPEIAVSRDGGYEPVWSPRGDALYFLDGSALLRARLDTRDGLRVVDRQRLFPFAGVRSVFAQSYDVSPDGDRFILLESLDPVDAARGDDVSIVLGWRDEVLTSRGDR